MKTIALLATLLLATALQAGDTEPVGPPWTRDFMKAHAEALSAGKPIFLYFTKTYCPHCVPVEKNLLPNEKLKPIYGDLAWVFVYNDFKGGEADLATDRVRARFSISTWPNLLLVDPNTLEVIGDTGRTVETFLPAAAKAKAAVKLADEASRKATREKLEKADALAAKLQGKPAKADIEQAMKSEDIAVQAVAVEYLAKNDPKAVLENAAKLLDTPNDQVRGAICQAIAAREREASASGKEREASASVRLKLEALVIDPKGSRNPNVLRINIMKALAKIGAAESIAAIKQFAEEGGVNNGLTGATVDALGEIGARDKEATEPAQKALLNSFPKATDEKWPDAEQHKKMATALAKKVHEHLSKLSGTKVDFPSTYTEATRQKMIEAFTKATKPAKAGARSASEE